MLYINEWNTIYDYEDNQSTSEWWLNRNVIVDPEDIDGTFEKYLELLKRVPIIPNTVFTEVEQLIQRLSEFYDRKSKGIKHIQDIRLGSSKLTAKDQTYRMILKRPRVKKKNIGIQLNFNLFD